MSCAVETIEIGPLTVGSTYRFRLEAEKDGVVWDLSAATVQLILKKPDDTETTYTATVTDGPGGVAVYDSAAVDLDVVGGWRLSWKVTDGSVIQKSLPIPFAVEAAP